MIQEKHNVADLFALAHPGTIAKKSYPRPFRFAVVGATGIVGQELLAILAESRIPVASVLAIASANSAGERVNFGDEELVVQELSDEVFNGIDVAFFGVSSDLAKKYVPIAAKKGAVSIDKSSAYRMDKDVPLVVPDVNSDDVAMYKNHGVVASPNCTATPLVQVLAALNRVAKLKRVVMASYQAVSGAGKGGLEELDKQTRDLFNMRDPESEVFNNRIAFNVIPCIPASGNFSPDGSTEEEQKVIDETRRILKMPDLKMAVTCARVPVFNGHSEAVNIEFDSEMSVDKAREVLANAPGIVVIDDIHTLLFPTPADATGEDYTLVGRIRRDNSVQHGISLWLTSDNLRTGAALNAVRIAEILCSKYLK
jgi:aspartate-semialdehyde dehydrogenase